MMGNPTMIPCESGDTLKPVIEGFNQNRLLIVGLLKLPTQLLTAYEHQIMGLTRDQLAIYQEREINDGTTLSEQDKQIIAEAAADRLQQRHDPSSNLELLARDMDVYARVLLRSSGFATSARGLYSASIVFAWTMFETLTKDAFIAIQQARPDLDLPTIDAIDEQGNLILNFTGLDKMRKSYRSLAGSEVLTTTVWKNADLRGLVTTRNQIVHSGGVITQGYCKLVQRDDLIVGDLLHLDYPLVKRFVEGALNGGFALLVFLDTWLINNPAPHASS